jgi:hypothetical protein
MRDAPQRAAYSELARLVAPGGDAPDVDDGVLVRWGWRAVTYDVQRAACCLQHHPGARLCVDIDIDRR